LKCVILDAEAISDFDSTAAEALENLDADLERRGVDLWVARANEPLRKLLQVTGLTQRLGKDNVYPSVRAAVKTYRATFVFQEAVGEVGGAEWVQPVLAPPDSGRG
jgi:sulfate permease, SulP family